MKINIENFHASIDKKVLKSFVNIAKKFPNGTGFVPCYGSPELKKVPCKGANGWESGKFTSDNLTDANFINLEMLSLVLGSAYVAIDADGKTALELLAGIGLEVPDTLQTSSNLGERHCWIFKIPEKYKNKLKFFKIDTADGEQLEFRTGKQYQVIAGIHPVTKSAYLTNGKYTQILELPEEWCEYWLSNQGDEKAKKVNSGYKQQSVNTPGYQIPENAEIIPPSIYIFLSKETRQLLDYGISEGGRNDACFRTACDIIGTVEKLQELEIGFSGVPEEIYQDAYKNIPGHDSFSYSEFIKCWESADGKERDCVKDEEILKSLAGIWDDEFKPGVDVIEIQAKVLNKVGENSFKLKKEGLIAKFRNENPNPSQIELIEAAQLISNQLDFKGFGNPENSPWFQELIRTLGASDVTEDEKLTIRQKIKEVSKKKQSTLDIDSFVASLGTGKYNIFNWVTNTASVADLCPSKSIICFLTTVSSLLPKHFDYGWNYKGRLRPNIFTVLVAPPTSGKDIYFAPFTSPLHEMANEASNKYRREKEKFKQILSDWNEIGKAERKPTVAAQAEKKGLYVDELTPSQLRELYFEMCNCPMEIKKDHPFAINVPTLQYINEQAGMHKDNGLLINPSELADFISRFNQVNKDKQGASALIKIWNGDSTLAETKSEECMVEADYYQCSLLSGIQPKRFKEYIGSDEPSGIAARMVYLNIEKPIFIPTMSREEAEELIGDFDAKDFYLDFQETMNALIPTSEETYGNQTVEKKIKFTIQIKGQTKAQQKLNEIRLYCEERATDYLDNNQAAYEWFRRLAQNIANFALTIHALRFYYGLESDMSCVSEESLSLAFQIGKYLENQYLTISETLAGNKTKLDDSSVFMYEEFIKQLNRLAEKKGKKALLASDLTGLSLMQRKDFLEKYGVKGAKRLNKPEIIRIWQEMHDLGLGLFDKAAGTFETAV